MFIDDFSEWIALLLMKMHEEVVRPSGVREKLGWRRGGGGGGAGRVRAPEKPGDKIYAGLVVRGRRVSVERRVYPVSWAKSRTMGTGNIGHNF